MTEATTVLGVRLTPTERAQLEVHRIRLGLRSGAQAVRALIKDGDTGPVVRWMLECGMMSEPGDTLDDLLSQIVSYASESEVLK